MRLKSEYSNNIYSVLQLFKSTMKRDFFKSIYLKIILLFIILSIIFCLGIIAQRSYGIAGQIVEPIRFLHHKVLKRKLHSYFVSPHIINIDIKHADFNNIQYTRKLAIEKGTIHGVSDEWFKAKIRYKEQSFNAKIKLKGTMAEEHLNDKEDKWSFHVKIKGEKTLLRMKAFALMSPMRRGLLSEWFYRKVLEKEGIITRNYEFVEVVINGKQKGIYVIDERYDKIMQERNDRKESVVLKLNSDSMNIQYAKGIRWRIDGAYSHNDYHYSLDFSAMELKRVLENESLKSKFLEAKNIMEGFRSGLLKTHEVFDVERLAKWFAISDVMGAWHGFAEVNMRFYYNPVTSKFEPVPDDGFNEDRFNEVPPGRLFRLTDDYNPRTFLDKVFSDYHFTEKYLMELGRVSKTTYLDRRFSELDEDIKLRNYILAKDYSLYDFLGETSIYPEGRSKGIIYENAKVLRAIIDPDKGVQSYLENKTDKVITIKMANNEHYPIEILYLIDNKNNVYKHSKSERIILKARKTKTHVAYRDFNFNLLEKHNLLQGALVDLKVKYKVLGVPKEHIADVFPYRAFSEEEVYENIHFQKGNYKDFAFLGLNEKNREIIFDSGSWVIDKDLIIPAGYKLIAHSGVSIDLTSSAMIFTKSPVIFRGTKLSPIKVFSSDKSGQGIAILNAVSGSLLSHVEFSQLSRPKRHNWELSGALNFYESPVSIYNSSFENNIIGDDYLNVIRSKFRIDGSFFLSSNADAVDIDFSNGIIRNTKFFNCGFNDKNGDCLDLSGSIVDIENISVKEAGDKGISIGEFSEVTIKKSEVSDSNIGVASKDLSIVNIEELLISNVNYGAAIYQKKPEYGASSINAWGLMMQNVVEPYLIEEGSSVTIEGVVVEGKTRNVIKKLYPETIKQ
jgi:hypothetical protein